METVQRFGEKPEGKDYITTVTSTKIFVQTKLLIYLLMDILCVLARITNRLSVTIEEVLSNMKPFSHDRNDISTKPEYHNRR